MKVISKTGFEDIYNSSEIILTEGALVERLKSEFNSEMDDMINHAGLIYTNPKALEILYGQYIEIAQKHDLPIMIMTPTRKLNKESLKKSPFHNKNIVHDSCIFLNRLKAKYNNYSHKILIGGLLGCKGDAYSGKKVLDIHEAYIFHKQQAMQFAKENIDFLFAGIMPEINETIGMAKALSETNIPYIISFMMDKDACLLDGTKLSDAIEMIDKESFKSPVCYMTNCIHPTNLLNGLSHFNKNNSKFLERFTGIQSNASLLSPEELNNCGILHTEDFDEIVNEMIIIKNNYKFKIFGGCCGTNDKFMESLTIRLINKK